MEKVKLTRQIATYIEDLLIGNTKGAFLAGVMGNANSPKYIAIRERFQNDFDTLLIALVNGYEVEQTPEDKVREIHNRASVPAQVVVEDVLNVLGIKIEGINA